MKLIYSLLLVLAAVMVTGCTAAVVGATATKIMTGITGNTVVVRQARVMKQALAERGFVGINGDDRDRLDGLIDGDGGDDRLVFIGQWRLIYRRYNELGFARQGPDHHCRNQQQCNRQKWISQPLVHAPPLERTSHSPWKRMAVEKTVLVGKSTPQNGADRDGTTIFYR